MAADPLTWVPLAEALKLSGLSRRTLNRRVADGVVSREEQNGRYVYSVADLERVSGQDDEGPSAETRLLGQAYRMIDLLITPARQLNEALAGEVKQLRERCAHLEKTQVGLILAREAALDRSAERELRIKREERESDLEEAIRIEREEQRERGTRTLVRLVPHIMAKLGKSEAAELAKAAVVAFEEEQTGDEPAPTNGVKANVS